MHITPKTGAVEGGAETAPPGEMLPPIPVPAPSPSGFGPAHPHSVGRAELEREARGAFRGKAREPGSEHPAGLALGNLE